MQPICDLHTCIVRQTYTVKQVYIVRQNFSVNGEDWETSVIFRQTSSIKTNVSIYTDVVSETPLVLYFSKNLTTNYIDPPTILQKFSKKLYASWSG